MAFWVKIALALLEGEKQRQRVTGREERGRRRYKFNDCVVKREKIETSGANVGEIKQEKEIHETD